MSVKGLRLVTFDATNTLLKFRVPPWQYYTMVAQDYGFKGSEDQVKTKFKKSYKHMWEIHPNFGKKSMGWQEWWTQVVCMTLKDHLPPQVNLVAVAHKLIDDFRTDSCWECAFGGNELLHHFRHLGIRVGVISNFDPRLSDILANVGLQRHFDFIVTSYEAGYNKPDERIFQSAIAKCSVPVTPPQALHIGDDFEKDYQGARAAGWHAILINPKLDNATELPREHVYKSLKELRTAVGEMNLKL